MRVTLFEYNISWQLAQLFAVIVDTPTGMAKVNQLILACFRCEGAKNRLSCDVTWKFGLSDMARQQNLRQIVVIFIVWSEAVHLGCGCYMRRCKSNALNSFQNARQT
jgi:hypothetical protein